MTPPPVPPGPADDEPDPTGIRALLGSLPDPGPMPADLVQRITASLAAERAAHDDPTVVPLRRRSWGWKQLGAVAAALAVIGVGIPALAGTSPGSLLATLSGSSSSDSSAAGSAAISSASSRPGVATGERAPGARGAVTLAATATAYTAAGLATQAAAARDRAGAQGKTATGTRAAGPADSTEGLRACLTTLGVEAWMPVWGDSATYEGRDAVIAVVSGDTGQVVYAVSPGCDRTHPARLAGPLPVP